MKHFFFLQFVISEAFVITNTTLKLFWITELFVIC